MAKVLAGRRRVAAAFFTILGPVLSGAPARAQISVGVAAESPSDALARNMKILGTEPKSFEALIGAGRAALALGDTQAAAGFFGRAEEVWPTSPLAQAGMGAALAQEGDGSGALQYFARAMQRGATQSMIGCDRGLAYDLLGRHADAQADYRVALYGSDADESRRRLALSLAITGKKADALSTLSPLMARGDAAAARTRAFVLALTGDSNGAKSAMEAAMPGSGAHMAYFFQKLPALRSDQKAAAVNLGIFPNTGQVASASPPPVAINSVKVIYNRAPPAPPPQQESQDRIASIQQWLTEATKPSPDQSTAPAATDPSPASQQIAADLNTA